VSDKMQSLALWAFAGLSRTTSQQPLRAIIRLQLSFNDSQQGQKNGLISPS